MKLVVLINERSASASELLINGLAPHINVVQIGETTVGKNVGSIVGAVDIEGSEVGKFVG